VAIPRVRHMAYAHGGFFGAAPFVLASPQWVRILRKLLPDVYVEISRRVLFSPAPKLIHWAENNPVVAAYGVVQSIKQDQMSMEQETSCISVETTGGETTIPKTIHRTLPTIEWDVFLNPRLVRRVQAVLEARDQYLGDGKRHGQHHCDNNDLPTVNNNKNNSNNESSNDKVLQYLDKELKQRAQELTDQLLIAHGNVMQLLVEQTGVLKAFNYSRVARTRRTLGGGMYARQWMAVFAEALRLGRKYDDSNNQFSNVSMEDADWLFNDEDDDDDFSEYLDCCLDTTISGSCELIQRLTQTHEPLSLVLDLKSRHVPKRVLGVVIDTLQSAGVRVEGIASFQVSEIRGVCNYTTSRGNSKTKEILFVHSAGDLQLACDQGLVQPGDKVFFNGGSLIHESARASICTTIAWTLCTLGFDGFDPRLIQAGYRIHPFGVSNNESAQNNNDESSPDASDFCSSDNCLVPRMLRTLHDYKRHYSFSMGVYVQEFSIDDAAARLLIEHVNEHSELYDLGFAWGGVNGMTVQGIQPGRFTSTDGYWNQRHLGRLWEERVRF